MKVLSSRVIAHVGIDAGRAEWAIGMTLGFLKGSGAAQKVSRLVDATAGAQEAMDRADFKIGARRGAIDLGSQLVAGGLTADEATGVIRETIRYAREKLGKAETDELVDQVLGLREFL